MPSPAATRFVQLQGWNCSLKPDVHVGFFTFLAVKKLNTPEYSQYLKLWNEETKPKQENTKDLPKLNQVKMFFYI